MVHMQTRRSGLPDAGGAGDRTVVVTKFYDGLDIPDQDIDGTTIEELGIGPWSALEERFPGIRMNRMVTALEPPEVRRLIERAVEADRDYRPRDLLGYFEIEFPAKVDPDALVEELRGWKKVETAYVDREAPDPQVNAVDDPRSPNQGYLDPAPDGIDAEYAWGFSGGDGGGIGLIDVERGWTFGHEDVTGQGATLLHGTVLDGSRRHGTSVLGVICAVDNTIGCVGVTPNLGSVDAVSYYGSSRVNAIAAALLNLGFGDVLLLEAQVWATNTLMGPIEVFDAEYDWIRLATALGIVVVEAGGNGNYPTYDTGLDLDGFTNGTGLAILNPASLQFRDSGAIMVAAGSSTAPHTRLAYSTFGDRIDCFAWGEDVDTCSSDAGGGTTLYRTNFSGTSSASAIVAGAAVAVQGLWESNHGYRLSPRQVREVLNDATTATTPAAAEPAAIGVMPNLRAIIDNTLNLTPDVYIRDFVGDQGEPHAGAISASPDVILLPATVANPQAAFGAGSGNENSATLGFAATANQDNFVYLRVLNQGGAAAANVEATVFWAPAATLVTPDLWTLVGSVTIPAVPDGDVLTVSNAITWPAANVPGEGHYCFVALIGNEQDPAPGPGDFAIWSNFTRFIRENNNVTWRNFNVEANTPSPDLEELKGWKVLPFLAAGAPDKARRMRVETLARLPRGSELMLEVPEAWIDLVQPHRAIDRKLGRGDSRFVPLNPHRATVLPEFLFPARLRAELRLMVRLPEARMDQSFEVAVRQLWEDQEVGRVTWHLVPRKYLDRRARRLKELIEDRPTKG